MSYAIDASDWAQLADHWARAPELTRSVLMKAMTVADLALQSTLQTELPKGAGGAAGLQGSIATEEHALADNVIGTVSTRLAHAVYVEIGTKPHPVGKEGIQALTDWVQAKLGEDEDSATGIAHAIAWKIRRSGTKANPVWQRTWNAKQAFIRRTFSAALTQIANELAKAAR